MVTDITEIGHPSLALTGQGYFGGTDFQVRFLPSEGNAWNICLDWFSGDSYPSEAEMVIWENNRLTVLQEANELADSRNGLREKIDFSKTFHAEIKILFNAVLEETETQTVQPDRYTTLRAVMDAQTSAFRNRFNNDLMEEAGIDSTSISTTNQRRTYSLYLRLWISGLAILLGMS